MFYKTKHKTLHAEHLKTLAEMVKLKGELFQTKTERDGLAIAVEDRDTTIALLKTEKANMEVALASFQVVFEPVVDKRGPEEESLPLAPKKTRGKKTTSTTVDL